MKINSTFSSLIFCTFVSFAIQNAYGQTYEQQISDWRINRIEGLKKENGWLNLAGLYWLNEGRNTIGSDTKNDHLFPSDRCPDFLAEVFLNNGEVDFVAINNHEVLNENQIIGRIRMFPSTKPVVLQYGSLKWFIIKRGQKYAIRLRDLKSPYLEEFSGIDNFDINPKWKIKARFEKTEGKKIPILDVTGQTNQQDSPGKLVFNIKRKTYSLDALAEGDELFIIFGDKTNKVSTYGGGRYIYTSQPDKDGFVWIDFNKAYNPPCAFTPFATCPLPPQQNILKVKIEAGEKTYGNH